MSDRKNRDVGRKRQHKRAHPLCNCWHCLNGADKKRLLKQAQDRLLDRVLLKEALE